MLLEAIRSVQTEPSAKAETKNLENVKGMSFKDLVAKLINKKSTDAKKKAAADIKTGDEKVLKRTAKLPERLLKAIPAESYQKRSVTNLVSAQHSGSLGENGELTSSESKSLKSEEKSAPRKPELKANAQLTLNNQGSEGDIEVSAAQPKVPVNSPNVAENIRAEGGDNTEIHNESSKATLKVVDLRTVAAESTNSESASIGETRTDAVESTQLPFRSVEIEIRPNTPVASAKEQAAPFQGSQLLAELKDTANTQIVRNSGIVLRDGGDGEIRLNLKPENLGSVRIRLSLHDNQVTGRIIVDNANVREVFEQNLDNLYRAFKEGGFNASGLQVTVGGEGWNRERGHEYVPGKMKRLEVAEETSAFVFTDEVNDSAINLVV